MNGNELNLSRKVNSTEAVCQLLRAFQALAQEAQHEEVQDDQVKMGIHFNLRDPSVYRRMKTFLMYLEMTNEALELTMASRKYRHSFTHNYRALMPPDRRIYRVDVLEAGQEGHNTLWVNGTRYLLPDEVLVANSKFRSSWACLLKHLTQLSSKLQSQKDTDTPWDSIHYLIHLGVPLLRFDLAWAEFERHYIEALMLIEREARSLLTDCLYLNEELKYYEDLYARLSFSVQNHLSQEPLAASEALVTLEQTIQCCCSEFIHYIAQLNSKANTRRQGRSDFRFSIIKTAAHVVCAAEAAKNSFQPSSSVSSMEFISPWIQCEVHVERQPQWIQQADHATLQLLRPLAEPLLKDLQKIRDVMTTLSLCPERIDPHLAQNYSLVDSLVQFEAQWDAVWAYLDNEEMLHSLTTFLSFLHLVLELDLQHFQSSPSYHHHTCTDRGDTFEEKIASFDVSAFLILSRLAVLFCVSTTQNNHTTSFTRTTNAASLKKLLPETFHALACLNDVNYPQSHSESFPVSEPDCCPNTNPKRLDMTFTPISLPITLLAFSGMSCPSLNEVPLPLQPVLQWGLCLSSLCSQAQPLLHDLPQPYTLEDHVVLYILERCVKDAHEIQLRETLATLLPSVKGLQDTVTRFIGALEESSMILQRTNPKEWNAFLQTTFKCLVAFRASLKQQLQSKLSPNSHSTSLGEQQTSLSGSCHHQNICFSRCSTASSEPKTPPSLTICTRQHSSKPHKWLESSPVPSTATPPSTSALQRCLASFPNIPRSESST